MFGATPRSTRKLWRLAGVVTVTALLAPACSVATTAAVYRVPESAVTFEQRAALYSLGVAIDRAARSNDPRLVCIRSHESRDVLPTPWHAYNAAGPYYGAYQYVQGTWDTHAQLAGRPDLVGLAPIEPSVAWYDQDAVTLHYLDATGDWSPWGGPC